jgi:hypothetical protein
MHKIFSDENECRSFIGGNKRTVGQGYTQVDNLAKIPARSCQDLSQDLSKIMPRSYINPARSWKDLA